MLLYTCTAGVQVRYRYPYVAGFEFSLTKTKTSAAPATRYVQYDYGTRDPWYYRYYTTQNVNYCTCTPVAYYIVVTVQYTVLPLLCCLLL